MHSGVRKEIADLHPAIHAVVVNHITPKHHSTLDRMGIEDAFLRMVQFIKCNLSSYDYTPDIIEGELSLRTEYVACPLRGKCDYEGKGCQPIVVDGQKVTMAELRITSLIRDCYQDKEICDIVGIQPQTLRVHKLNIQTKLKADRKPQVAMRAVQYGIG
jgi:DNA-binding CsgD family transcriptional regulator